jgi:dipeptidyl aminopeptidase/acylaminoacyl peptidase
MTHLTCIDTAEHDAKSAKDFSSALVFDKTYFRHWDTYDNHKNSHVFALDLSKTKDPATSAVNVLPHLRQFSCPVPPHGDSHHYAISPDGKEIAFASMGDFDKNFQAWSTNTNIYIVPTDILHSGRSSMPKCLSCKNKGANSIPLYAPNGNYLAWLEMRTPQYEADKNRLIIYDRRTGTKKDLTANWDRSVDGYIWSEDCATIYASVGEHGRTKIFAIDVATGSYKPLVSENSNSGLALVPGTNLIVFSKNSLSYPTEFYTVNGQSGEVKRRSFIHQDYMSAIKTSEVQDFWFEGAKKDQVMGWFLKPNDFKEGKKYPLAFIIHGGPQSAWMDSFSTRWNLQAYAGAGFAVAVVNFHGSNTYGQAFTDSINKNWGSYPFEDLMKVYTLPLHIGTLRFLGIGRCLKTLSVYRPQTRCWIRCFVWWLHDQLGQWSYRSICMSG